MDDYSKTNAIVGLRDRREIGEGEFQNKGYLSNSTNCLDSLKFKNEFSTIKPDTSLEIKLQSIIDTCKNRNIQLVITYAPEYKYQFAASIKNFTTFT